MVHGLSSCGPWASESMAQYLQLMGLVALCHVGSSFPNQGLNLRSLLWKVDS